MDLERYALVGWERDAALAVLRLGQAVHQYRTAIGLGRYGLDSNASKAIITLCLTSSLTPSQLAAAIHLTPPATTELLDRLGRAGYIRRVRHPTDRRKMLISATTAGEELVAREWNDFAALLVPTLAHDDEPVRAHLIDTINNLVETLERANHGLAERLSGDPDLRPPPSGR